MAGDESTYRPPSIEGGHAHPPDPGAPLFSPAAANHYQNPNTISETPPCKPLTPALAQAPRLISTIPLAQAPPHIPLNTSLHPPHTSQATRENLPAKNQPQPLSQDPKNATHTLAQSLVPKNPTLAPSELASVQAAASASLVPASSCAPVPALSPASIQAPPDVHLPAHVPVLAATPRAPTGHDHVPAHTPAHASAPTPTHHTAQDLAPAAQAPALVLAQAGHAVHAAHSIFHTHARCNVPTSDEANIVPQANPSTTHAPSYAQASLGLASFYTAEDSIPQPCLDFQNLNPVGIHDGKPSIRFKKVDKQRYLGLMKHVLVGKFSHGRPTIAIIEEFFIALKLKGVASVCVELDVSKPLGDKVWVSFEDDDYPDNNEGFWQRVDYDEIPHYCSKCFHMGHSIENCKHDFEKERMLAAKGRMEIGAKPAYVRRRNYCRVYNPKAAQSMPVPKPANCIASTSTSIQNKKDDLKKFPKPVIRRGGVVQRWMAKHFHKKTVVEEVVTTNNPFASLSEDQEDTQPELVETISVG
ncbi:hypothetical protein LIER_11385 [Lithospermum erythrorhizon]|uniref:DUF4283 domain-containing protein n=1 Tax=Lithospermum erythrorhizon TaxID=34254 RepID=A0AAV3PPE7_LITER